MSAFRRTAIVRTLTALLACGALALPAAAQTGPDHLTDQPLKVGVDMGFAPFAFKTETGQVTGFAVDVSKELARRLGRPGAEIVDIPFKDMFASLFAKRIEMIPAPVNITAERAKNMLYTEPYMPTGLGFLTKGRDKVDKLEDLKGKAVGVNNGSISDKWLTDNEAKYGYTVQRYNKNADAVQAVLIGRAYANLADVPVSRYVANENKQLTVAYVINTGNNFGWVTRKDDIAFRDRVDEILECMKKDGTLGRLHEKWFGPVPAGSSTATVYPGRGAPGFEGYDEKAPPAKCS